MGLTQWEALSFIRQEPQFHIACTLGIVLVREAPIRDLNKAINYLDPIYRATATYEPALCYYSEALYKRGDYLEAARLATELHERAKGDPEWKSGIPPGPMGIAASAFRAEAKHCKKEGRLEQAVEALQQLVQTGFATVNDRKMLDKLLLAKRSSRGA
jgi:tetratricopeptide (TPR) repeat protein